MFPGEGNGTPLQYSCMENPMDGGAWWATVHGVTKSQTRLSDFLFTFHFHALEKEMATHSSVLAWRIPGTGEPGGLPSMGSHRVRHDWSDLAAAAAATCLSFRCGPGLGVRQWPTGLLWVWHIVGIKRVLNKKKHPMNRIKFPEIQFKSFNSNVSLHADTVHGASM